MSLEPSAPQNYGGHLRELLKGRLKVSRMGAPFFAILSHLYFLHVYRRKPHLIRLAELSIYQKSGTGKGQVPG